MFFYPGKRAFLDPEPLGLEALAAMIPDCDIRIIDQRFEDRPVKQIIQGFMPDIVGVTATTSVVYQAMDILKTVKEVNPEAFTVVGGSHASSWPQDFNLPSVNAVVIGMGEEPFKEVVEAVSQKKDIRDIKGLAVPAEGSIHLTPPREINRDMDSLPFPRRDLTDRYRHRYRYIIGKFPLALISTSRGCVNRCSFCAIWRLMNGRYITRSPENVVEELATINQNVVRFADGNTFGDIKRVHALVDRILESGIKKFYIADISTNIIIKQSKLIEKMKAAGLSSVVLGVESVDDEKLDQKNKRCTVDDHIEAINILHQNELSIAGNFICDADFEVRDFHKISEFIDKQKIDVPFVHVATPLPGTQMMEQMKDSIITDNYHYFDLRHQVLPTKIDRKLWWKEFKKLEKKCMYMAFDRFPAARKVIFKTGMMFYSMATKRKYKLKVPGRPGTNLHEIVANNRQSQAQVQAN